MQAGNIAGHQPADGHARRPPIAMFVVIAVIGLVALLAVQFRSSLPFVSEPAAEDGTTLSGAFLYQQQRHLSCEYASVHIAATIAGHPISEYDVGELVPLNENPHLGYRGNIHGDWGNTTDYGVYNEPLNGALSQLGIESDAFYAAGERSVLTDALDQGRPTVMWLAMRGDVDSFDAWAPDGTRFKLTQWMHVMVAYGYDETGVYLTDPGTAVWRFYGWDEFMAMWNVMDGMGLSVYP